MKSNIFLSFLRVLELPLKLLVEWLGKSKYGLKKDKKKDYEPRFKKNEELARFKVDDNKLDTPINHNSKSQEEETNIGKED